MMSGDLSRAVEVLRSGGYTAVFCRGDTLYTERARGVTPLLSRLDAGDALCGYAAADKVVGRGAAFLYLALGIGELYAEVLSEPAQALLSAHGVSVTAGRVVPYIVNRSGDGQCPIERAVTGIDTPSEAIAAIRVTLKKLAATKKD